MNKITRQSISDDEFLYLLGVCQWVFNSNCNFIIEMIDNEHHNNSDLSWNELIKLTAGNLLNYRNKISKILGKNIYELFEKIVDDRNSIIHSIPTGEKVNDYVISVYRNDLKNKYIKIDKVFLINFIKNNEKLSDLLHYFRGY